LLLGLLVLLSGCGRSPEPTHVHGEPMDHWLEALRSRDARVRKRAVTVLGNVGPADAAVIPALTGAVRDPDAGVRAEAVLGLLKIGPPARDAVPVLTEATKDRDPRVRAYAARALERVQGRE
jgi:HEAT repeat protein